MFLTIVKVTFAVMIIMFIHRKRIEKNNNRAI